ncbi:MAG: DUF6516 family protein [Deltaproteobacteria bacterium]|nr:DUF6516 family protein [Deltaproteobacteria bacterium]
MIYNKDEITDHGLEYLLDLDGNRFQIEDHYFVSFKASKVPAGPGVPHGIKYALVLFDRYKTRIICYDNAHAYPEHHRIEFDHVHKNEVVFPYDFKSAGKLMEDFWSDVNNHIKRLS